MGLVVLGRSAGSHRSLALAAAQSAVSLDPENAVAHAILGYVLMHEGESDSGAAELTTALQINPNHADGWSFLGVMKVGEGRAAEGIDCLRKAFRLNPHSPGWCSWHLRLVQYAAGRYEDTVETLRHEATHRSGSQRKECAGCRDAFQSLRVGSRCADCVRNWRDSRLLRPRLGSSPIRSSFKHRRRRSTRKF